LRLKKLIEELELLKKTEGTQTTEESQTQK
jgi:hypothetical protein